jgi:hypothetical protein
MKKTTGDHPSYAAKLSKVWGPPLRAAKPARRSCAGCEVDLCPKLSCDDAPECGCDLLSED